MRAGSPIEGIRLVMRIERREPGFRYRATSLPGHMMQATVSGRQIMEAAGREYLLRPGSVVWFHDGELIRGRVTKSPWIFYSVVFSAPELPPPDFEHRMLIVARSVRRKFANLRRVWQDTALHPMSREFRCHAILLDILADFPSMRTESYRLDPRARLWWEIENELRQDLRRRITLATINALGRASPATIARACHRAVGLAPMKRVKRIRMSLARGLLRHSDLSVTEVAYQVGYARVHEFSRDYRKAYGVPPSADRPKHG